MIYEPGPMSPDAVSGLVGPGRISGVREALRRRRSRLGDRAYSALRWAGAGLFGAVVLGLLVGIGGDSSAALQHSGIGFVWSGTWNPAANQYGAGILVIDTLLTTAVAMVLMVPIGLGTAIFLSELAPRWLSGSLATLIGLLAAVPSIVVGLWGLLVLTPIFANQVEPFLASVPALGWLFRGEAYGPSILLASAVLAVMTLPTMVALSRSAFGAVPLADREAALALGATRWQVVRRAVFPAARAGVSAAITLAVGRALGESIAVAMVIGNRPAIPESLTTPGATLGSAIVNQFAEASPGIGTSSVIALGAVLLLLTVAVNAGGQTLLRSGSGAPAHTAGALR